MRRLFLGLALATAVAAVAADAGGSETGSMIPTGFRPEAAAAFGPRDIWLLGGTTLVRSTDAGRHFTRVRLPRHLWNGSGTVPTIVFADSHDGYAYGTGWLFSTHDGGRRWHRSLAGDELGFTVGGGYAFAVTRRHGLERSPVARDAWRLVLSLRTVYPIGLAARGSRVWLIGPPWHPRRNLDTIRLSANRGRTFTKRTGPCYSGLGGGLVPAGGDVVWAVCPSGMMAGLALSTNNGRTFSIRSFHDPGGVRQPGLTNAAEVAPFTPRIAILDGGYGPLLRTIDDGKHWKRVRQPGGIEQLYWMDATTHRVGLVLVQTRTASGSVQLWRTTDAGASWQRVPTP
jgi:photosystem II stability/assembly factor-like uncharacterized protein